MTDNDLVAILSSMLTDLPNVYIEKKANHASFRVGKKVFAYTRDEDVVIKLPKEKVKELIDQQKASPLVMGKKEMKEWAVIQHSSPNAYKKDLALFKTSLAFVSAGRKN